MHFKTLYICYFHLLPLTWLLMDIVIFVSIYFLEAGSKANTMCNYLLQRGLLNDNIKNMCYIQVVSELGRIIGLEIENIRNMEEEEATNNEDETVDENQGKQWLNKEQ